MKQNKADTMPVYPIGKVIEYTGLSARQLRYYEQRGLLEPARSEGNQRLYSTAQVRLLRRVRSHLHQGLNLAGIRKLLQEENFELPLRTVEEPSRQTDTSSAQAQFRTKSWLEEYPGRHRLTRAVPSIYPPSHLEQLLRRLKEQADQKQSDSPVG